MYKNKISDLSDTEREVPKIKGYKILIAMPGVAAKTEGGIIRPDELIGREELASIVGCVMAMGDLCYLDKEKFPTGPWCSVGDWVMFRSYSGTRFKLHGQEFRLINDDTVEAVVDDPRGYSRA